MERVTKTVLCDMCGAEIDIRDDDVLRMSALSGSDYYYVLVHERNQSYAEGRRDSIAYEPLDLCPECADRAAAIHCEVVPTDGGRSCRHELSWREGR